MTLAEETAIYTVFLEWVPAFGVSICNVHVVPIAYVRSSFIDAAGRFLTVAHITPQCQGRGLVQECLLAHLLRHIGECVLAEHADVLMTYDFFVRVEMHPRIPAVGTLM